MEMLYLLLVLTRNGAGDISAAFVNSESLEACRVSQAMVEAIFTNQQIPLLYSDCRLSSQRFTPFEHVNTSRARRYPYLVDLGSSTPKIQSMADWQSCRRAEQNGDRGSRIHCVSSTQRLIAGD